MLENVFRAAPTGDTDPIYYIAAMGVALIVMIVVMIIGSKRKK